MPPEETKTQDTPQQDSVQAEPVVETTAPIEQPVKLEPVETPINTVPEITPKPAEQVQEETPVVEPPVEPTIEQVETLKIKETQTTPKPPQPQIQERIVYKTDPNIVQKLLIKARAKIQERKRKKLDKIMALLEAKPQVMNKDIQKLLRISSATTVRYMNILERENRVKQVGNTGKSVFYTKV